MSPRAGSGVGLEGWDARGGPSWTLMDSKGWVLGAMGERRRRKRKRPPVLNNRSLQNCNGEERSEERWAKPRLRGNSRDGPYDKVLKKDEGKVKQSLQGEVNKVVSWRTIEQTKSYIRKGQEQRRRKTSIVRAARNVRFSQQ